MTDDIRACCFDVFGTVVDWHGSVSRDLAGFAAARGVDGIDWVRFTEDWRRLYHPAMQEVRSGRRPWTILDVLHREGLVQLLDEYRIDGLTGDDIDHMNRAWHRLDPWPDSVPGLTRLKAKYVIAPCSNGNIALIVDMAKRAGLPWDVVLGAEPARAYKPMPEAYLASCRMLDLQPRQVLMVAAHNVDLDAARACGLQTAFVPRATERDLVAGPDVDLEVDDLVDLATKLGC
jgi:2-haloacid dehalogenase